MTIPGWLRAVAAIAALKVGLGLLGFALGEPLEGTRPGRDLVYLAHVVVFAVSAAGLALGGREDRRARLLALCYLLVSSQFADRLLLRLGEVSSAAAAPMLVLGHVQVEAFLGYVLLLFVRHFPRVRSGTWRPVPPPALMRAALVVGAVLLPLNLLHVGELLGAWHTPLAPLAAMFARYEVGTLYNAILFLPVLPAYPLMLWKARQADPDERRRVRLLTAGLAAGSLPMVVLVILMSFWPAASEALRSPQVLPYLELIVYAGTLTIPLTTGYAVLVQQALDVRLVIRRAVRYALAKYTVLTIAVAPLAGLAVLLFVNRDESLTSLLTGTEGVVLAVVAALGVLALLIRRRILTAIDRRFFREQYDAGRILHSLVEGSRGVSDAAELESLLVGGIDRAMHLDTGALLVRTEDPELMLSPERRCRPIHRNSSLSRLLGETNEPFLVPVDRPDARYEALPLEDRQWVAEGGFRLLLPLTGSSGGLVGMLALGGKRSELPFTDEDRLLLRTVALSARVTVENRLLPPAAVEEQSAVPAAECVTCGAIWAAETRQCPRCGARTKRSQVPVTLSGKFRVEKRIGRGGMGVVYRAADMHLGRRVAVKTLPWIDPHLSLRLRREARAMAAVSHPNLAMIHGVEFFQGTPMLVVEYLAGGTLADRLTAGPMPWRDALALGIPLAEAVERIHAAGILHRDIKPSNVGFTGEGMPKLLDFGLARAIEAGGQETIAGWAPEPVNQAVGPEDSLSGDLTASGVVAGTIAYLSPEAVRGQSPDPSLDLWSLAVVLYEAIAGGNPLRGETPQQTMSRILASEIPDIRSPVPACPDTVAEFFAEALAPDFKRRPGSARALARRLRSLLGQATG